jgi:hypothetical protein
MKLNVLVYLLLGIVIAEKLWDRQLIFLEDVTLYSREELYEKLSGLTIPSLENCAIKAYYIHHGMKNYLQNEDSFMSDLKHMKLHNIKIFICDIYSKSETSAQFISTSCFK